MKLSGCNVGIAFTGSFCTYDKIMQQLEHLVSLGANVTPIFSDKSQTLDSRFGRAEDFMEKAQKITSNTPILTIPAAEPLGPKNMLDILLVAPCTGNTLAKLCHGITDTPVLMACKGHLRNDKPLVLFLSTNDALGINFKNIGTLLNTKHIYFVPFGQDNCTQKPNSMVSRFDLIVPSLESALENIQLQPVIQAPL
ncbi:dipicolinate synthase subunit B [Anaeromicropila populeti]|uniref:Dipicolinate synthase subunit B n=1 Tax=Anaeromicropila populeti TaxID=37658 RepID=A0A1I6JW75_9FIRM|nr:dipicolinate synthase subunit B [Anaeromicropila populeti]SFR83239.1 dipicolinate synthase subunit B [Anaeromicropila populeti]